MPATDFFTTYAVGMESPVSQAFAVAPSDTGDLPPVTWALHVGGAGNLRAVLADGTTMTFTAVSAGWHPVHMRRVLLMIGTGLGLGATGVWAWGLRDGSTAPPPPDSLAPALPVRAAARWHPGFSQVATQGGCVISASDLQGLAQVTAGGAGLSPQALTDRQGRRFWRFAGGQFLDVAAALVCAPRKCRHSWWSACRSISHPTTATCRWAAMRRARRSTP